MGQAFGAQRERRRVQAVLAAVLAGQGSGQLGLGHVHGGVSIALPPRRPDAEHADGVFGRSIVQTPEHLVHRQHQILADLDDQLLVLAFLQLIVQNIQRIFDELFVHRGQHTAAVHAAAGGRAGVRQVGHADGLPAAVCAAAQQVIAADAVIISHLHHKRETALADAFLVMGELRLADAQVRRSLLLGDTAFFAQQRQNTVELAYHTIPLSHRFTTVHILRDVYYICKKTLCKPTLRQQIGPINGIFFAAGPHLGKPAPAGYKYCGHKNTPRYILLIL